MIIKVRQPAPDGERFAPSAFHDQLGRTIRVVLDGEQTDALLGTVEILDDGAAVELGVVLYDDDSLVGKLTGDGSLLGHG